MHLSKPPPQPLQPRGLALPETIAYAYCSNYFAVAFRGNSGNFDIIPNNPFFFDIRYIVCYDKDKNRRAGNEES